ncbi:subtilisin-like protease SBT5.3 [Malania oleifera]|uniref:subtilisin-like protease SBT5.3 n=1 Tax=Malania oleifera TaxID=397392 RepID=UPI0025AE7812|nr:subtilisin-like protease SBT5.3 [Malania oleifera]
MRYNSFQSGKTFPICPECGRRHLGECKRGENVCYRCGRPSHMAWACKGPPIHTPVHRQLQGGYQAPCGDQQRNTAPERVYALMPKDAEAAGDIVTSATHSFVSSGYAKLAGIEARLLDIELVVAMSIGSTVRCRKSYVVYLGGHSGVGKASEWDAHAAAVADSHYQLLGSCLGSVEKAKEAIFYSYTNYINGFAAVLDDQEAIALSEHPKVISVFRNEKKELHTTRSWKFLGLEGSRGEIPTDSVWPKANFGEDVIIANLDTGVWPESESFSDEGITTPIPNKWKGSCDGLQCNRKLIGARYFSKGFEAALGRLNSSNFSPRDTEGHGSHTLSIAGGRFVYPASLFGSGYGTAKGGAPLARLATYKVCWFAGCFDADILAAFDVAIYDRVDILSLSLGSIGSNDYFSDSVAIGSFHATQHGILVVCSAGNEGPNPSTVTNVAPWILTVGAATIDRDFPSYVVLGNNKKFKGVSYITNTLPIKTFYPLIQSVDAKATNASTIEARLCVVGSLDPTKVSGKIVHCCRGGVTLAYKAFAVAQAGGIGMILSNQFSNQYTPPLPHILPTSHVSTADGLAISSYIYGSESPVAYIIGATEIDIIPAPMVPRFSSVGPNNITSEILKPDVTAPGVSILAAFSEAPGLGPTFIPLDQRRVPFNILSGTSMSCPHVSGAAALVKAIHPGWSPAAIKSAIMTSARTKANAREPMMNESLSVANFFSYGAGLIRPNRAADPGLVYDLGTLDYLNFLCAIGYNATKMSIFMEGDNKPFTCPPNATAPTDLNYPSITIPDLSGKKMVYRTVRNVGDQGSTTYTVRIKEPAGILVKVEPESLRFEEVNQKQMFTVTVEPKKEDGAVARDDESGDYRFGMIIWSDRKHSVRSPLVVGLSNKKD